MAQSETAFLQALDDVETLQVSTTASTADICNVYKKVKPVLTGILPFIELIPVWGKRAAAAIRLLQKGLDMLCP